MVRGMGEAAGRERRAVVDEIVQALGDQVEPESNALWQYLFVVAELGADAARELVREVQAVEANGGMPTRDGSRRRTPGGVFFALAYERLGPKRSKSVRWRAMRRSQEELLKRLLRLIAMALPASPEPAAASAAPAAPPPPVAEKAAPPVQAAAKPARRQEPEAVEVLVVRRRPTAASKAR